VGKISARPGFDVEHLEISREGDSTGAISFSLSACARFHGSVPAMLEEIQKQIGENRRVLVAAPNTGELERLADIFSEYGVSFRLGSRTRGGESYADETSYFAVKCLRRLWRRLTFLTVCCCRMLIWLSSALAICSMNQSRWFLVRSGRNPRSRHSFPIFAISRLVTTWSMWNTASGSITG